MFNDQNIHRVVFNASQTRFCSVMSQLRSEATALFVWNFELESLGICSNDFKAFGA